VNTLFTCADRGDFLPRVGLIRKVFAALRAVPLAAAAGCVAAVALVRAAMPPHDHIRDCPSATGVCDLHA
jgi:hypothetical protein